MIRVAAALAVVLAGPVVKGPYSLRGPNLEVRVPAGWFGQACGLKGGTNPGVRLANFRLLPECQNDGAYRNQLRLRTGDLLIIVNRWPVSRGSQSFFPNGRLRVSGIAAATLEGTAAPAQSFVRRRIHGRFYLGIVDFGERRPAKSAFAEANRILALVRVD